MGYMCMYVYPATLMCTYLDEPEDDAVDPNPQRPELVVPPHKALHLDAVQGHGGPEASQDGGDDEGEGSCA